jgi:23S rRNA G2445 N2-methylase RlmL
MKKESPNPGKELYKELRKWTWEDLWTQEVPRFDAAAPRERVERVGLIRALGVVALESGTPEQRKQTRQWLLALLQDPEEKVRRYAIAALPKIGAGAEGEEALLSVLTAETGAREKTYLGRTLDKIGGAATLEKLRQTGGLPVQTEQKVKAHVARKEQPGAVRLEPVITDIQRLRVHLRGRKGLEAFVREEWSEHAVLRKKFKLLEMSDGLVALAPLEPFSLGELYQLRCFGSIGLVLGAVPPGVEDETELLAGAITSPLARSLFQSLTEGTVRYRLEFVDQGARRGLVQEVANRVYIRCPEILNDAKQAPWAVDIHETKAGNSVELRPRISPDPRYLYRVDDIPAASHPPLASSMARLAGRQELEVVWDPFCGSGLELIESALLGGVTRLVGTDLDEKATGIARSNIAAANLEGVASRIACRDFRSYQGVEGLGLESVSLILTNPPLGRRVRIPDMRGLFSDLFRVAAETLRPGGRLVFANPLKLESPDPRLKWEFRKSVDLGGFECRLEKWVKKS